MNIENLLYDFYTSDVPDEISNEILGINDLDDNAGAYIFNKNPDVRKQIIMKHIKAYLQNVDLEREINNEITRNKEIFK